MKLFTKYGMAVVCSILLTGYSRGQAVSVSFGPLFTHTQQAVPMIHSREDFSNTDYAYAVAYEHFLKIKKLNIDENLDKTYQK